MGLWAFWRHFKRAVSGTHIWVSKEHLQKYLWEHEFRWNLRRDPQLAFDFLLRSFPKP